MLYIMSRAILSLIPRLYSNTANPPRYPMQPLDHPLPALTSPEANPRPIPPAPVPFTIVASLSWAMIMYMFRHRGERLQPGIVNSMRKLGKKREDRVFADTAQVISTTSRTPGTTSRRSFGTTSKTTPNQRVCLTLPQPRITGTQALHEPCVQSALTTTTAFTPHIPTLCTLPAFVSSLACDAGSWP